MKAYVRENEVEGYPILYYASRHKTMDDGSRGGPYFTLQREWESHALNAHWHSKDQLLAALKEMGYEVIDETE